MIVSRRAFLKAGIASLFLATRFAGLRVRVRASRRLFFGGGDQPVMTIPFGIGGEKPQPPPVYRIFMPVIKHDG